MSESIEYSYVPVPPFADWSPLAVNEDVLVRELHKFRPVPGTADDPLAIEIVSRLTRQAAAESVAIEGFYELRPGESRTIASSADGWEAIVTRKSAKNLAIFNAQLEAFQYLQEYVRDGRPISEHVLRELHQIACHGQDAYEVTVAGPNGMSAVQHQPLQLGEYKTFPNNVTRRDGTTHWYCPPADATIETARFVRELQTDSFKNAHPVVQVAYAHYSLTHIHPFADGNGRVARALASYYSYRAYGVPMIVYSDRKLTYLQALEAGSDSRYQNVVDHFRDRITDTLSHAGLELRSARSENAAGTLRALMESAQEYAGISMEDSAQVASRLYAVVKQKIDSKLSDILSKGNGELVEVEPERNTMMIVFHGPEFPYENSGERSIGLQLERLTRLKTSMHFVVGTPRDLSEPFPFCVVATLHAHVAFGSVVESILLRFEDCAPELSSSALDKVDLLIDRSLSKMLEILGTKLKDMLMQSGHLKA